MGFGCKIKLIAIGGFFSGLLVTAHSASAAICDASQLNLRGDWGQAQFNIEVADDAVERAQGLMNRETMARTAGMLFVYDFPQEVAFWMRNTLIPLDMIFIDPSGLVTAIHENAIPLDETAIPGGQGVQYVLEVNGGLTGLFGITVGSEVQYPGMDQNIALWACEQN